MATVATAAVDLGLLGVAVGPDFGRATHYARGDRYMEPELLAAYLCSLLERSREPEPDLRLPRACDE